MDGDASHMNDASSWNPDRSAQPSPGLLSKLSLLRSSTSPQPRPEISENTPSVARPLSNNGATQQSQQSRTRRRRGSLRKAALLGRGAQRDRRDSKTTSIDSAQITGLPSNSPKSISESVTTDRDALGLTVTEKTLQQPGRVVNIQSNTQDSSTSPIEAVFQPEVDRDRSASYNSTTDEDDILQISRPNPASRTPSLTPGTDTFYSNRADRQQLRGFPLPKSPLSYSGISTNTLPPPDTEWGYSETEWWGWVVLTVTWLVFVVGMGSCLNAWSWAWDVGKTPYAPPELEDDPTLPIVGYYPALIILTCIMAWVWVVVAWVGMKYFRHAKISGD